MSDGKPNILLIISDSTRADRLSCYGYHKKTTPNIDKLAKDGSMFSNAIVQGIWTLPSHASLFTGLYPSEHGLLFGKEDLNIRLDENHKTLAEYLKSKGYVTIGISNNPWVGRLSGMDRGFDFFMESNTEIKDNLDFEVSYPLRVKNLNRFGKLSDSFFFRSLIPYLIKRPVFTKISIELMMNIMKEVRKKKKKFFIFVNFMDTHQPYYPPKRNFKNITNRKYFSSMYVNYKIYKYYKGDYEGNIAIALNDYYDASLNFLDEQLGRLFTMMEEHDIMEETLAVFTSDHGKNLCDYDLHNQLNFMKDNLLRIPLIIRYPKKFPPRVIIKSEVQLIDLFYTILDLVSIDESEILKSNKDALSLINIINGEKRGYSYVEAVLPFTAREEKSSGVAKRDWVKCIRTREGKLIKSRNEGFIYYDLLKDPNEKEADTNVEDKKAWNLKLYLDSQERVLIKRRGVKEATISEKEKIRRRLEKIRRIRGLKKE